MPIKLEKKNSMRNTLNQSYELEKGAPNSMRQANSKRTLGGGSNRASSQEPGKRNAQSQQGTHDQNSTRVMNKRGANGSKTKNNQIPGARPPLLPPTGRSSASTKAKIPGTFSTDPEYLKKSIMDRAGIKQTGRSQ